MSNILTLARSDFKRMFSNVMTVIITVGLIVTPSIFSWYNILACWDVFNNTDKLKVAVANSDEGYKGDLIPIKINVGEEVISELRANDQIGWVFTDEEDAIDGAKSGRYYAAIVIPKDFSRDMLTFYSDDVEHASVIYYSNEKKSAIAPKVTGQGADAVSSQVNQVFAEKMSEIALVLATSISKSIDENGLDDGLGSLADHVQDVGDRLSESAGLVRLYSKVLDSAAETTDDMEALMANAKGDSSSIPSTFDKKKKALTDCAKMLRSSVSSMKSEFEGCSDSIDAIESSMNKIFDEASNNASGAASSLRSQSSALATKAQDYRNLADELNGLKGSLPAGAAGSIDSAVASLNAVASTLDDAQKSLASAASKLESGVSDVSTERANASKSIKAAKDDVAKLQKSLDKDIAPAANDVADHAEELANTAGSALDEIFSGIAQGSNTAAGLSSTLGSASSDVSGLTKDLDDASDKLVDLAKKMKKALASKDVEAMKQLLTGDVEGLSQALAAPVALDRIELFPTANFGSAMTPLYATLALFIGSLLIMVATRPTVCRAEMRELKDPKPHQIFFGRFAMVAFLSIAQSTLMALGNMFFLQVQVEHPWLFMLCYWVSGLVFVFIIYSLVSAFANLGKAISVIMLIVQITGCGGSFPIQMFPQFVQALSPWLPATYVVNSMRAAMFGTYGNDFWVALGMLLLFLIPAAIVGLVLKRPLSKFMKFYLAKVEESGLIS